MFMENADLKRPRLGSKFIYLYTSCVQSSIFTHWKNMCMYVCMCDSVCLCVVPTENLSARVVAAFAAA